VEEGPGESKKSSWFSKLKNQSEREWSWYGTADWDAELNGEHWKMQEDDSIKYRTNFQ
jgi:hypothetical protein